MGMSWQAVAHTKAHAVPRACHDKPWHTPRHAMASRGTHQGIHGKPWLPIGKPRHTKACRGTPWHTPRHAMAAHGLSWHPPRHAMAHTKACNGTNQGILRHTPTHTRTCSKSPSAPSLTSRCFRGQIDRDGWMGGGTNRSDTGLNLSGSWQQGHSATYNTPSRI